MKKHIIIRSSLFFGHLQLPNELNAQEACYFFHSLTLHIRLVNKIKMQGVQCAPLNFTVVSLSFSLCLAVLPLCHSSIPATIMLASHSPNASQFVCIARTHKSEQSVHAYTIQLYGANTHFGIIIKHINRIVCCVSVRCACVLLTIARNMVH